MPNKILLKKSSTANATPTAGQLDAGELAINTADGRLFAKNAAGTVVNLPVTSISGQTITPDKVTAASGAGFGTSANPTNFGIAGCKLLTRGDAFIGNAAGTVGVHVGVVAANTWDNVADSVYLEALNEAVTQYKPMILTAGFFPQLSLATSGKIGVGTANPQTNFQIVTNGGSSTLLGAAQTEIFQIIDDSADEYVNLGRFHCNSSASRGSFSLSNSGTNSAWQDNVLQFFCHGSTYAYGYYGGNTSDAGCAMIVTQGTDIVKLQIGNYGSAPIEFFTNNEPRLEITSDGNYSFKKSVEYDSMELASFNFYNRYDSGSGEIGNLARIQCKSGDSPSDGVLTFATSLAGVLTDRVVIDENGNVILGTLSSAANLYVNGTANFVASTGAPVTITNTGTGNSFVVNDAASDTTPFVVDSSGNVGVGTSTPSGFVAASRFASVATTQFGCAIVAVSSSTGADWARMDWKHQSVANTGVIYFDQAGSFSIRNDSNGPLLFLTNGANERMRIAANGSVGIGTNSPATALDVVGDIKLTGALRSPGEMLYLWSNFR
jgi:hypothetical protein